MVCNVMLCYDMNRSPYTTHNRDLIMQYNYEPLYGSSSIIVFSLPILDKRLPILLKSFLSEFLSFDLIKNKLT